MINDAIKILIPSSFGGDVAASISFSSKNTYYKQLAYTTLARGVTTERLNLLGRQLASLARLAWLTRRPENVETISQLMHALPLPKSVQALTHYYDAQRLGSAYQFDASKRALYQAAEHVAPEYKSRVFQMLGWAEYCEGYVDAAVPFLLLAGKLSREHDPVTFIYSQQFLAYIRSENGDPSWAAKTLESIFPSVLQAARTYPVIYPISLNNYAAHLGDMGRVDEAQAALSVALNSSYASAFPEWGRTRDELETKRRHPKPSFVSLTSSQRLESSRPQSPKLKKKKLQRPKPKRIRGAVIARALHWLAGLSIFRSTSFALIFTKPLSVDLEALLLITFDWLTSGPGPRAPPSIR